MNAIRAASALLLWGLVVAIVGAFVGSGVTAGQTPNRAALVITSEDGATHRSCVAFDEEEISGAELLRRSGLSVVFSHFGGLGAGVCSIDGTGCNDPGDCFCQCRSADCAFWTYFALGDGRWRFQRLGASQRRVHDGEVHGWAWGDGRTTPPDVTFGDVCPLSAAPTRARPATATSRPPATATARATAQVTEGLVPGTTPEGGANGQGGAEAQRAMTPPATAQATLETTASVRRTSTPDRAPAVADRDGRAPDGRRDAALTDDGDGGPDGSGAGLIAFGAVAAVMAVATGALVWRRRAGG